MTPEEKARELAFRLKKLYPDSACSLEWKEPWQLMIMGRLSAQCTDARVNIVCRDLFREMPTLSDVADCDVHRLEEIIRPCGLYRKKAENVKEACRMLRDDYGGVLPDTMEELLKLAGVGRKVANLLLGDVYNVPGIVADTHCIKIGGRFGFYPEETDNPVKVEKILSALIPEDMQTETCHRFVDFGRDICSSPTPKCDKCPEMLRELCDHYLHKSAEKTRKDGEKS
ncbi:MAG: endonuclease III [Ruminococcus sp.]|nr:endonuclease III [Candidatus Apopatosoma intestinale]